MVSFKPYVIDPTPRLAESVRFRTCAARPQHKFRSQPFHVWVSPSGAPWLAFYRHANGYRLSFPGVADFHVSQAGHSISSWPVPGVSGATVQHLYQNQILPLALSRQGKLVFHGSAVEIDEIGVAFLGASGKGKSTLAAGFAASGYRFLTDDALVIEGDGDDRWIRPSHPSIRLWDDSHDALISKGSVETALVDYTPKIRILAGDTVRFCGKRRRLQQLYFLGERKVRRTVIEPISAMRAVIELVKHSFMLDIEEHAMISGNFSAVTNLVKRTACFRLDYPRQYAALSDVRDAIISHVRDGGDPDPHKRRIQRGPKDDH